MDCRIGNIPSIKIIIICELWLFLAVVALKIFEYLNIWIFAVSWSFETCIPSTEGKTWRLWAWSEICFISDVLNNYIISLGIFSITVLWKVLKYLYIKQSINVTCRESDLLFIISKYSYPAITLREIIISSSLKKSSLFKFLPCFLDQILLKCIVTYLSFDSLLHFILQKLLSELGSQERYFIPGYHFVCAD